VIPRSGCATSGIIACRDTASVDSLVYYFGDALVVFWKGHPDAEPASGWKRRKYRVALTLRKRRVISGSLRYGAHEDTDE
jgi:hypothetical protein